MSEKYVEARGVDAAYPTSDGLVLQNLDLAVQEGEIVALVGPNGSGKSTLLRALGRILKPRGGTVLLEGHSLASLPTREVAQRLALLPQGPTLSDDLTVHELVWMGRSPHQGWLGLPNAGDKDAVDWAARETSIETLLQRNVSSLSGGERQRVWLAMALAQQPRLLLLDEPTTFLDLSHQLELLELVRYLNAEHGLTVVMVLHDLNQAARYAHRVVVLHEGAVQAEGTPQAVLTPATLRAVFGIEGEVIEGPSGVGMVIVPVKRT
jgi:ABC-type cobalamin/Fe3+-siderophores transport system ATPase subunit